MNHDTIFSGINNPDSICYAISLIQLLFSFQPIRQSRLKGSFSGIAASFQNLIEILSKNERSDIGESVIDDLLMKLSNLNSNKQDFSIERQEDVASYFSSLITTMKKDKNTANDELLISFQGYLKNTITGYGDADLIRSEAFYFISLNMRSRDSGFTTLEQSLDEFTRMNSFELADKGSTRTITKVNKFSSLSRYMIFHLKRFEFEAESQCTRKLDELYNLPFTLDMQPYMANPSEERKEGHALYELGGIIVHEGDADDGHYYTLVRLRPHHLASPTSADLVGQWLKLSDSRLTLVEPCDVPGMAFGGDGGGSAFMVMYERVEGE